MAREWRCFPSHLAMLIFFSLFHTHNSHIFFFSLMPYYILHNILLIWIKQLICLKKLTFEIFTMLNCFVSCFVNIHQVHFRASKYNVFIYWQNFKKSKQKTKLLIEYSLGFLVWYVFVLVLLRFFFLSTNLKQNFARVHFVLFWFRKEKAGEKLENEKCKQIKNEYDMSEVGCKEPQMVLVSLFAWMEKVLNSLGKLVCLLSVISYNCNLVVSADLNSSIYIVNKLINFGGHHFITVMHV